MAAPSRSSAGSRVLLDEIKPGSLRLRSSSASQPSTPRTSLKRKRQRISSNPITPSQSTADLASMSLAPPHKPASLTLALPASPPRSADPDAIADCPSPVPTEIIDVDAEDFVRTSKQYGVKVRDFAYEELKPGSSRVPEIWRNPFLSLLAHDLHIRRPHNHGFDLPGKVLRRLLDEKLVTEEEARRHWTEEDWQRLKAYDERPLGPYPYRIAMKKPKPSVNYRVAARIDLYGEPLSDDIPDEAIYHPEEEANAWDGDEESLAFGQMLKKRRVESDERRKAIIRIKSAAGSQPHISSSQSSEASSQEASQSSQSTLGSQPSSQSSLSQSQPQSQTSESSQTEAPKLTLPQDTSPDNIATPPTTPVALPEIQASSLSRSTSFTNLNSPSASSTNVAENNNNVPRSRRLGRRETLQTLLVA